MLRSALLSILLMTGTASAQSSPAELAQLAAEDLAAAFLSLKDAEKADDRVSALTQTIRAYEDGLTVFRAALRAVAIRERAIEKDFAAKRDRIERMLGVMQTIENTAAPLLLMHPSGPIGTARSGMILSEVTPALQAEAEELKAQLNEVVLLRGLQESSLQSLEEGLSGVQEARTKLSQAVSQRTDLPRRFVENPEQLRNLVDSAQTLEAFASALKESPDDDVATFASARGTLPLPVQGQLLRRFNEADAAGVRRPGILLATRARALVAAPWPSTIRYAGPLLDYGNVMILEPAGGYLMVLAGLSEVYGEVGQVVPADTPLGLMGGANQKAGAFLADAAEGSGGRRAETLYIELRVGEGPVDPSQWFALNKE